MGLPGLILYGRISHYLALLCHTGYRWVPFMRYGPRGMVSSQAHSFIMIAITTISSALALIVLILLSVALITLAERKVMAALQRRVGPKKRGTAGGILQPFADGIKLVAKESLVPLESTNWLFLATPFLALDLALVSWLVLPLDRGLALAELVGGGLLILIAISEISIYSVILSGWSANSKFPLVGGLRSTAQMISYSLGLSLLIVGVAIVKGTVDLLPFLDDDAAVPFAMSLLHLALLFAICALEETNRAPFDLPEAESELVAGFFTEHSAVTFALFFLAEFTNIFTIAALFALLFFAAGLPCHLPFLLFVLWVRAGLARMRFDQLLSLGWKSVLPLAMAAVIFLAALCFTLV